MIYVLDSPLESDKQNNNSSSIRITNECVENAKVNFKVDCDRLICVEDNQAICCQGFVFITKKPNGILLEGTSSAIKNFAIGETIEVYEGDAILINDQVVIEFKQVIELDDFAPDHEDDAWN